TRSYGDWSSDVCSSDLVGIPARPAGRGAPRSGEPTFEPYAVGAESVDPVARALNGLLDEVATLRARVAELERGREPSADERQGEIGRASCRERVWEPAS